MQDTDRIDSTKLIGFFDTFFVTFRYYDSEFQQKHSTEVQSNKELCKCFCSLVRLFDLPIRMNLDGIYNYNILQTQFRTKVLQFQITQQMSGSTIPKAPVSMCSLIPMLN